MTPSALFPFSYDGNSNLVRELHSAGGRSWETVRTYTPGGRRPTHVRRLAQRGRDLRVAILHRGVEPAPTLAH